MHLEILIKMRESCEWQAIKFGIIIIIIVCLEPYVVSQSTAASSASCKRSRPPSNLVNGQELTMCDIVWISPQSHSSLSVKPHFLWHVLHLVR